MNYYRYTSSFSEVFNQDLHRDYLTIRGDAATEKTHFFEGRYENIYIPEKKMPKLSLILQEGLDLAAKSLNTAQSLKVGFWFNEMNPGDITIKHTHDEDDELLSGVYYINVPYDSGNLVFGNNNVEETIAVTPKVGEFIFFAPEIMHGVENNQSEFMRLSIGMNFGPAD